MTKLGARPPGHVLRWLRCHALWIVATLWLVVFAAGLIAIVASNGQIRSHVWTMQLGIAALLYVFGHFTRVLRLALIIGDFRVGMRILSAFHFLSAGVGLALPFKLGDIFRIAELPRIVPGGILRAATIVWIERVFDIGSILLLLLIVALTASENIGELRPVLILSALFVLLSLTLVYLAPENLRRLSIYVIRRYEARVTVPLLKWLHLARRSIAEVPKILRGKQASLIVLTLLIWISELATFALVLDSFTPRSGTVGGLLSFISSITVGQTVDTLLREGPMAVAIYLSVTQVPLVLLGISAAAYYATWRHVQGAPRGIRAPHAA